MDQSQNPKQNTVLADYLEMVIERDRAISEVDRLKIKAEMYLGLCKQRRAIALDMAAHVAEEFQYVGPEDLKERILNLISIDQNTHDALVIRYRLKERHGQ